MSSAGIHLYRLAAVKQQLRSRLVVKENGEISAISINIDDYSGLRRPRADIVILATCYES